MKKFICIALAALMLLAVMAGCGEKPASEPASAPAASDPAAEPAKELEKVSVSFAVFHAETSLDATEFIKPWLDEIVAKCADVGYDLEFDVYYGETLCSVVDTYKAVLDGTADMGMFLTAMPGLFKLDEVLFFPQNGTTVYASSRIYQDLYNEFEEIRNEWTDVHVVGQIMETPQSMMCNKDFTSIADSKGMLWNTTGAICTNILDKFGWASVSAGPTDVYTYAERGIIDGCGSSAKNMISNAWYEVLKNVYNCSITNNMESIIMNKAKWDSLPAAVQGVFDEMGIGSGDYYLCDMYDSALAKIEDEYMGKLTSEYGMTSKTLSDEALAEFQSCIDTAAQEWAAALDAEGQPGSAVLARYYELVEKYSADEYKWDWAK